jgi:hypothetical protein
MEQNNFPKISELPVYRKNFTIYCSFVMPLSTYSAGVYFNMWFISDG